MRKENFTFSVMSPANPLYDTCMNPANMTAPATVSATNLAQIVPIPFIIPDFTPRYARWMQSFPNQPYILASTPEEIEVMMYRNLGQTDFSPSQIEIYVRQSPVKAGILALIAGIAVGHLLGY